MKTTTFSRNCTVVAQTGSHLVEAAVSDRVQACCTRTVEPPELHLWCRRREARRFPSIQGRCDLYSTMTFLVSLSRTSSVVNVPILQIVEEIVTVVRVIPQVPPSDKNCTGRSCARSQDL